MARTATQDANAGTTSIAEKQATRAKVGVASPGVSADRSLFEMMEPVVEGTTQALQTLNNAYQQNAAAEASMRQGQEEGVNAVDQANKRGKFMTMLFGQDAGYSTAVGIATKNFANNEYIRQMGSVEEHLDKTPEEFQQVVGAEVEAKLNETYKDDPMARNIAQTEWASQSRKLAREHTAKHMVYAQEQVFAAGVADLTTQFDDIHLNMKPGSTPEAQVEAAEQLQELLDPNFAYVAEDGSMANPRAARNIQLQAVTKQLVAGNSVVLHAIPENFREGLTVTQNNTLDTAYQQYDNAQAREGELIVEQGLLAAASGNMDGVTTAITKLNNQRAALSGSTTSKEKWTEDKRRLTKIMDDMRNKVAKATVDQTNAMMYYKAREEGDAPVAGQYYSKKAEKAADEMVVMVAAANAAQEMGIDDPVNEADAIKLALQSPTAIKSIALRAERYGSVSESFAEAVKQRVLNIVPDENGYIPVGDLQQIDNLRELYRIAPAQMRKALGQDASAMLEITMNNSMETVKEIQTKRGNYIKNKSLTVTKEDLGLPSDMSIKEWIQSKTKSKLDPAALNYYQEQLVTGNRVYGGDIRAAEKYMMEQYELNNTQWRGRAVKNAGIIEEQVNIPEVLEMLEGSGMAEALIETRIPMIDDANPIRGFSDLNDVQLEVNPGTKELYIQSSQFSYPIVVQAMELQKLAIKAQEGKDEQSRQAEAAFKARMGELGKSGQMWPNPTGE